MTVLIRKIDIFSLSSEIPVISIAGAGGKTTLMFELTKLFPGPAVLTTTTKVGADQIRSTDLSMELSSFPPKVMRSSMWVSPSLESHNGKIAGCSLEEFRILSAICRKNNLPLINEADGAARRHIKAPAAHEPVIPPESNICIYVTGLDVLGKPVNSENVHRPEIFSKLTGLAEGDIIEADNIVRLLEHPLGGLKNIPEQTKKIVYLTHTESREKRQAAEYIKSKLSTYDYLIV